MIYLNVVGVFNFKTMLKTQKSNFLIHLQCFCFIIGNDEYSLNKIVMFYLLNLHEFYGVVCLMFKTKNR